MRKEQEEVFWETIKAFKEINLLPHVMIIGSWAEYLYPSLFRSDFIPNLTTRDVDFLYKNINIPEGKINIIAKLKEIGYIYDEVDGISRFYKGDLLELEFLTRILGAGNESKIEIKPLGIVSEGLRVINLLAYFPRIVEIKDMKGDDYSITVPEPAAYVIQKLLTNPTRNPIEKKIKDIIAVKELIYHIVQSNEHKLILSKVYNTLNPKQKIIVNNVCKENDIQLPL